ncbi:MAG: tRNA pseudouridine(38-40) synthase TruA [Desulfomonile tiedjei]|nr:tRNA pseudouridine(38-40) synthase TruA [Desulfomonile tiedjei]
MTKLRAVVEYDGTDYHGWQLQKVLPTIQGELESALGRILRTPTRVYGAGRTDAGVHAQGQVAHFLADWPRSSEELQRGCNALLPASIALRALDRAPEDFHARHSARNKAYTYQILNRVLRSPFHRRYAWHLPDPLDLGRMQEAAAFLEGTHDFATFGAPTDGTPSTVREVLEARWEAGNEGMLRFSIRATGFLRYMVRAIVGTLVQVGRRKIAPEELRFALESRQRSRSGPTAPPLGLFLMSVHYDDGGAPFALEEPRSETCLNLPI